MSGSRVVIRPATAAHELEALYRLRAEVFFGEDILKLGRSSQLTDELDEHPDVVNLIAVAEEPADGDVNIVGGVRLAYPSRGLDPSRTPYFDFHDHVPGFESETCCGSMLCVRSDSRGSQLASMLVRSAITISRWRDMRYLCAAVRPKTVPFFQRLGWEVVASQFDHPVELVPVTPMVLDLRGARHRVEPIEPVGAQLTV